MHLRKVRVVLDYVVVVQSVIFLTGRTIFIVISDPSFEVRHLLY